MTPDTNKTLSQLELEWETCEECDLGVRRKDVDGMFVFGEGSRRGIMFIGEGPGKVEEKEGRPFIGPSGKHILRKVIDKLGIPTYYITNTVCCRSCEQAYDGEGNPIIRSRNGVEYHVINDRAPTIPQVTACLPRLYEQIYLVDPILIVALGGGAASTLRGKPVKIASERGKTEEITIPGAWNIPVLTEKKRVWTRKVRGELVMPTVQNQVRYLMLPTLHPAYVLRMRTDRRKGSAMESFIDDMRLAADVYNRYMLEVYGTDFTSGADLTPDDMEEDD